MKKFLLASFVCCAFGASSAFAATGATGEYGNHCAWGLTMGKQVMTDCKINWKDSASNKTYCFSNEEAKSHWAKDTKTNITKANSEYAKISTKGHEHPATHG